MSAPTCHRCGASRAIADNFCPQCGFRFTVNLPAVRRPTLPAVRPQSIPPSFVGSMAVLALGTGIEWLARRFARDAARAAGRALIERTDRPEADSVEEMLYIRKVQIRR